MSDYFARLVGRVFGATPRVLPRIPSFYVPIDDGGVSIEAAEFEVEEEALPAGARRGFAREDRFSAHARPGAVPAGSPGERPWSPPSDGGAPARAPGVEGHARPPLRDAPDAPRALGHEGARGRPEPDLEAPPAFNEPHADGPGVRRERASPHAAQPDHAFAPARDHAPPLEHIERARGSARAHGVEPLAGPLPIVDDIIHAEQRAASPARAPSAEPAHRASRPASEAEPTPVAARRAAQRHEAFDRSEPRLREPRELRDETSAPPIDVAHDAPIVARRRAPRWDAPPPLERAAGARVNRRDGGIDDRGEATESIVRVTIGRVDVRAIVAPEPAAGHAPAREARRAPTVSLDDYLKRRSGGER